MGNLNQFQILGIASCTLIFVSVCAQIFLKSGRTFIGLTGHDISLYFIIGALACIGVALIFASGPVSEGYGPSKKWFLPLGPYAMPGSNNCAQCKGCRTGHSQPAYSPDVTFPTPNVPGSNVSENFRSKNIREKLTTNGWKLIGADWCGFTNKQVEALGGAKAIEGFHVKHDSGSDLTKDVTGFPTWKQVDSDGKTLKMVAGFKTIDQLEAMIG